MVPINFILCLNSPNPKHKFATIFIDERTLIAVQIMSSNLFAYAFQGDWTTAEAAVTGAVKDMLLGIQGEEPDSLLLEYVLVMVGNKKTIEEISKELNDFLSEKEVIEFCNQLGNYLVTNYPNMEKTKSPARVAPKKVVAVVKSQVVKPASTSAPTSAPVTKSAPRDMKVASVEPTAVAAVEGKGITLADLRKRRLENIKGEINLSSSVDAAPSHSKRYKSVDAGEVHDDEEGGEITEEAAGDPSHGWYGYDPTGRGGRFGGRGGFRGRFSGPPFGGRGRGRNSFPYDPSAAHTSQFAPFPQAGQYPYPYPPTYPHGYAFPPAFHAQSAGPFAPFPTGRGGRGRGRGRGRGDESVDAAFEAYTSKRTQESVDGSNDNAEAETKSGPDPASTPTPVPASTAAFTGTGQGWAGRSGGRGRGRGRGANMTWVRDAADDGTSTLPTTSDESTSHPGPHAAGAAVASFHNVPFAGRAPRLFAPRPFAPRPAGGFVANKKWVRESDLETALTSGR